jgi:hypothetical protein
MKLRQARKIVRRCAERDESGLPMPYAPDIVEEAMAVWERHPTRAELWFRDLIRQLGPAGVFEVAGLTFEDRMKDVAESGRGH